MKHKLCLLLALVLGNPLLMQAEEQEIILKWIHTSDVHGSLFSYNHLRRSPTTGGLASVYAYVQEQRRQWGDRLLLTDGGDVLQGQPEAYYYNFVDTLAPHLVAQCMNEIGYTAAALGNHDVETGHAVYDRWMAQCRFPVLGANVMDTRTGRPYLKPYTLVERAGVRIAILGLVTPAIPNWLPGVLWSGLHFEEMTAVARRWMRVIQEEEHPDLVVGLFHSGFDGGILTPEYRENATRQVAEEVPGFDLICYGHDHQPLVARIPNVVSGDTCVTLGPTSQALRIGEAEIRLVLREGKVAEKYITARTPNIRLAQSSEALAFEARFTSQREAVATWVNRVIGYCPRALFEREAYFGPCEFIDLVHQMQLDLTGADLSFAAPLSFDARIDSGPLHVSDMFALYKYENFLYTMRLTGREIKGFLEMSYGQWTNQMRSPDDHILLLDTVLDNGRRQGLKHLAYNMDSAAGLLYTVDVTKPQGERVWIERLADGRPFDLDTWYTVATNSYRGNGGGELMTRGAGIPRDSLASRILTSTEKDLRYYLIRRVEEQGGLAPRCLNHWRFVPEEWTLPALLRDRRVLFPDGE